MTEAYLGLLPAQEFISLLDVGNGDVVKTIKRLQADRYASDFKKLATKSSARSGRHRA